MDFLSVVLLFTKFFFFFLRKNSTGYQKKYVSSHFLVLCVFPPLRVDNLYCFVFSSASIARAEWKILCSLFCNKLFMNIWRMFQGNPFSWMRLLLMFALLPFKLIMRHESRNLFFSKIILQFFQKS